MKSQHYAPAWPAPNLQISFSQLKYIIVIVIIIIITNILTLESTLYRIYTILHVSYILYFMRLLVLQSTTETQSESSARDAVHTKYYTGLLHKVAKLV